MLWIRKTLILCFLMLGLTCLGQDGPLQENIHLHLNKTSFFKGEHLWFTAYVQDQTQELPSYSSTNLHVGLFAEDGQLLQKKLFLVEDGISKGDFKIDTTCTAQSYTLMAWTNYMKNFEQATPFLQKIRILGNPVQTRPRANEQFTISIHPEGQEILPNAFNSIGIKLFTKDNRPVKTNSLQLISESETLLQSDIQTNALGQARFSFYADPTQSYYLKLTDADGQQFSKRISFNRESGVSLSVQNEAKEVVVFMPRHSSQDSGRQFKLVIFHKSQSVFTQDYVSGSEPTVISIDRNSLPSGISTAVIFNDEMQPLSHRMFNSTRAVDNRVRPIQLGYELTPVADSLKLRIKTLDLADASFSISVLPAASQAYQPNNSIASSFLLQPYINGQLLSGGYFYAESDRSLNYQLDTRLMMEAELPPWHWGSEDATNLRYKNENLIAFKGKIIDADTEKERQVSLLSTSFGSINLLPLNTNKDFEANLPLIAGDSLMISVLNKKGNLRKPEVKLYFNQAAEPYFDYSNWLLKANALTQEEEVIQIEEDLNLEDRGIALEEVLITAPARQQTKFDLAPEIQGRIIDEATLKRHKTFASYIRRLGFQTRPNEREGGMGIFVFDPPGLAPVPVTINGMVVSANEVMTLPLNYIETMVYHKYVRPGQGPFIALTLRIDLDAIKGIDQYERVEVLRGFDRSQIYFSPVYPDYDSEVYKKYGALWWEPQLGVAAGEEASLTLPLNQQKEVLVIIEGMSADGKLYQLIQIIQAFEKKDNE